MAYNFVNASSQRLSVANALVTSYPVTLASLTQVASTNPRRNLAIHNADATERLAAISNSSEVSALATAANLSSTASKGTYAINTWFHQAGIFPSNASRTAYLDGSPGTENTETRNPTGVDRFAIGGYGTAYLGGQMAEVAVWDVALTDAEINSLAKGFKPYRIRPQSLVFYAPLIRNINDTKGGRTITNNNSATVAAHPRVI